MSAVATFIKELLRKGQHHFTTDDVLRALGGDRHSITRALKRLESKGELAAPQRSFYVIVPPEYHVLGCLPAEQFIPRLMEGASAPYYVALLSAAQLHGAAHHRPQRFQVMEPPFTNCICSRHHAIPRTSIGCSCRLRPSEKR